MYPSPSPDGTRLVYVRRTGGGQDYVRTLDLGTGNVVAIDVPGHAPAWSPLGDLIAYVDLREGSVLKVMRPDGTGQRQVSAGGGYDKSVQWSPDGKWLLSYNEISARIHLIDVATGVAMALGYSASMRSPSWRP
jgi:TolB protein